jgi:hypothetical protein
MAASVVQPIKFYINQHFTSESIFQENAFLRQEPAQNSSKVVEIRQFRSQPIGNASVRKK